MNGTIGVIACIPLSLMSTPPTDQEDCKAEPCETCKCSMWTSKKKRALKKEYPEYLMLCMECAVKGLAIFKEEMKGEQTNVTIVDIGKVK